MLTGIVITRHRLHQVLTMAHVALIERDPARAGAYLQVLRDLTAPDDAPVRGASVTETFHAPSLAAEEAQPAHTDTLPDGPGSGNPAPRWPPSAEPAAPPPIQAAPAAEPPPAQAAEAASVRRGGGRPRAVWTRERDALMREQFATSEDDDLLLARLNALPAAQPVPSARQVQRRAWELGIKRNAAARLALCKKAGAASIEARRARGDFGPSKWTPERVALLRAEMPACLDIKALLARVNALPGDPIASADSMRKQAAALGIERRQEAAKWAQGAKWRAAGAAPPTFAAEPAPAADHIAEPSEMVHAPEPAPHIHGCTAKAWAGSPRKGAMLPVTQGDDKAEAFECFDAGMTVRDVAADFGLPLSTLSMWQAEWKLRSKKDTAG